MAYPRFARARAFKHAARTAGDVNLVSASWVAIDAGLNLAISAQPGDVIEAGMNAFMNSAAAESIRLDVFCMNGATVLSQFGTANEGVPAWIIPALANFYFPGPPILRAMSTTDIVAGQVSLSLRYKNITAGATGRTIFANSDRALRFYVKNLGPADST